MSPIAGGVRSFRARIGMASRWSAVFEALLLPADNLPGGNVEIFTVADFKFSES